MKSKTIICSIVVGFGLAMLAGCSGVGAGMAALRMGKNASKKDSLLVTYIDGHVAKQNKMKKALMGHAQFKVKETVSTTPTFKFEYDEDAKFGRIRSTVINVYKEFEADYSGSPEFTIVPASNEPEGQLKPGVVYNLGNPGPGFRVMDYYGKQVSGITLQPGVEYMFMFTIAGDRSETIQIFFDTK